jgi:hypothetical protein
MCTMVARSLALPLAASLCLGMLTSCGLSTAHDYGVIVTWLINGVAPDVDQCKQFGISKVRFRLKQGHAPDLFADCDEGVIVPADAYGFDEDTQLGGFLTTDSFDFGKKYDYEVAMLDDKGNVVGDDHYASDFTGYSDDALPLLLSPVEIFAPDGDYATYQGSWTVEGANLASGCKALGIERVALVVTSWTDSDFQAAQELTDAPCTDGKFSPTSGLAYGSYLAKEVAFGANDAIVDRSDPFTIAVDSQGVVTLDVEHFDGKQTP